MEKEFVEELKAQLEDHDEIVVTDADGYVLDVQDIHWNSRDGRVEIQLKMQPGNA
jgi:hypothetical protein